jgi:hypothetical protein
LDDGMEVDGLPKEMQVEVKNLSMSEITIALAEWLKEEPHMFDLMKAAHSMRDAVKGRKMQEVLDKLSTDIPKE